MILFQNVHKSFADQPVLRGVDLEIPDGAITVILGSSGEGKTVLLKHIAGLIRPDKGKVTVDGTDLARLDEYDLKEFRKRFGFLFQSGALFDSMSVGENVAFPLREHTALTPAEISRRVLEKLSLVGLEKASEKMPSELSGGMRKRVGLARAIALNPAIILYDEPTTGLDPLTKEAINRLVIDMQKKLRVTSVVISHDIESTFQVADFVAMLHEGKIVASGAPEKFRKSEHPFVRKFLRRETE